jgi:hypothetical protein
VKVFFHTCPLRTTGGSQIQLDETDFEIGKKHPGSPTMKVNQVGCSMGMGKPAVNDPQV